MFIFPAKLSPRGLGVYGAIISLFLFIFLLTLPLGLKMGEPVNEPDAGILSRKPSLYLEMSG